MAKKTGGDNTFLKAIKTQSLTLRGLLYSKMVRQKFKSGTLYRVFWNMQILRMTKCE